jgi:hypothetical protein
MGLSRREMKASRVARCIAGGMDFVVSGHLCCVRSLPVRDAPFCASTVLVSANKGGIDHRVIIVGIIGQALERPFQTSR